MQSGTSEKALRTKEIDKLSVELRSRLPKVLELTGLASEASLHGKFGGKNGYYIDIKNEVIESPDQFINLWLEGFMKYLDGLGSRARRTGHFENLEFIRQHRLVFEYVLLFLRRTYLREYENLSKPRPSVERATIWIGQERASYGLLVTPRFRDGAWENDKSEIRRFDRTYWTIGHVLKTGLVIPGVDERISFTTVDQYLAFFKNTLVRASGSTHEMEIASRYCNFVRAASDPLRVPLLIPEFRYAGIETKHQYRLDFCVIHPYEGTRVGFELSPWSTHGKITGTRNKTQAQINEEAKSNFEDEMQKAKSFFRRHGIVVLIYTDSDLSHPQTVFDDIARFLHPRQAAKQLSFKVMRDFLNYKLSGIS